MADDVGTTPEEYYRKNVAIPFLDHLIVELDNQFSERSLFSKLLGLVPSVLCSKHPLDHTEVFN